MPGKQKFDWNAQPEVVAPKETRDGLLTQMGRGVAQGAGDIAMLMTAPEALATYGMSKIAGEGLYEGEVSPGQKARIQAAQQPGLSEFQQMMLLSDDDDIMPMQRMPGGRVGLEKSIEEMPKGGIPQEVARRVTRTLPAAMGGAGVFAEMTTRELMGLGGKKIAEQLGLGEIGQSLFDIGFSLAPNPKKYIETSNRLISKAATGEYTTQKEMVNAARRMGWSEEEIAPLVREGWFSDLLKKMSPRGTATERALDETAAAVTKGYETLKGSKAAQLQAPEWVNKRFVTEVEKALPELTDKAKKAIGPELQDLYASNLTGRDYMTFWQKINRYFNELPELQALKKPVGRALNGVSMDLRKDFDMANTLSQRFRTVSKELKPSLLSKMVTLGELGSGLKALMSFQLPIAAPSLMASRKLAELMTTNPRFMNLHKKMLTTVNAGQLKASEKIMNDLIGMVAKVSPEAAKDIRKTSIEELRELVQEANVSEFD